MIETFKKYFAPALIALLFVGGAQAAVYQWSRTAANNATADPTINWAEGMSPSSVNDSARAMMARIADYRNDVSGQTPAGGTATAYTATTASGVTATPTNGYEFTFSPATANGAGVTLRLDGGNAFPIITADGVAVETGALAAGGSYRVWFCSACQFGGGAYLLQGFYVAAATVGLVPIGAVLDYSGAAPPSASFAFANGQCISRTTYATYFALVGTLYGACDGVTTFGVPDLSNRVVAGTAMGGTSRITLAGGNFDGTALSATGGLQNHTLITAELPATTPAGTISAITPSGTVTAAGNIVFSSSGTNSYTPAGSNAASALTGGTTAAISIFPTGAGGGITRWYTPDGTGTTGTIGVTGTAAAQTFTGTSVTATFSNSGSSFAGNVTTPTFTGTSFGSSQAFSVLPPVMVMSKIVRIL